MRTVKALNYSHVRQLIELRKPFDHSSMSAQWIDDKYVVYSYSTPIAILDTHHKQLWLTQSSYSNTTGKHQSYSSALTYYAKLQGYSIHGYAHYPVYGWSAFANFIAHQRRYLDRARSMNVKVNA